MYQASRVHLWRYRGLWSTTSALLLPPTWWCSLPSLHVLPLLTELPRPTSKPCCGLWGGTSMFCWSDQCRLWSSFHRGSCRLHQFSVVLSWVLHSDQWLVIWTGLVRRVFRSTFGSPVVSVFSGYIRIGAGCRGGSRWLRQVLVQVLVTRGGCWGVPVPSNQASRLAIVVEGLCNVLLLLLSVCYISADLLGSME